VLSVMAAFASFILSLFNCYCSTSITMELHFICTTFFAIGVWCISLLTVTTHALFFILCNHLSFTLLELRFLLNPFWNHWLSLQSDWLSVVRFIHELHYFLTVKTNQPTRFQD